MTSLAWVSVVYRSLRPARLMSAALATMLAFSVLPAQCETGTSGRNAIKIGFLAPLTGVASHGGQEMLNGFKLFLEQNHYRLAGRYVDLIVENDESSAAACVQKLQKLANVDKVHMIDGIILANLAYAAAPVAEKLQIPLILPISASDDITKRKRYNWVLRTGWSASQAMHPFGEYAYKKLGYRKIATFGADYPLSWEMIGGFQKSFEDAGGQIVQKVWAPLGFKDFSDKIKTLRKDVDAVFVGAAVDSAEVVARQLKEFGPRVPIIGAGSGFTETMIKNVGEPIVGALTVHYYSAVLPTPAMKNFTKAYTKMYGVEPGHFSEAGYVSGLWIKKALESIKGDAENKEKLIQALKAARVKDAPRGPISMDEYGNPIENFYVRKVEKKNGNYQNTVVHTFQNISQFWNYNPEEFLKQPPYSKDYPPCKYCADSK